MRSPKLAALELKRFGRGKLPMAALVSVLLLPLLYGALYLASFWDPYSRLDRIPVALVNDDKGATVSGKKLTAGDEITEGLLESKVFEWHQVRDSEARKGVEDGTYYLSLTMPSDFSERIASSSGDSPETGALEVRTNDANNYIVGQISRSVFSEVRKSASQNASRSILDKIFISFSDIHDATEKAANGADKLKGGIGQAKEGSKDLADGLESAKDGSGKLKGGIGRLNEGAGDLEKGAREVAGGTQKLADQVNGISDAIQPYFKDNGKAIGDTARLADDTARATQRHLDDLVKRAPAAAAGSRKAADALAGYYEERCEDALLPDKRLCDVLGHAKTDAEDVAEIAADVNELLKDNDSDLKTLDKQLDTLQTQAKDLAKRSPHLDEDVAKAVRDINRLNSGAQQVAKGADRIHSGLAGAQTGSAKLDTGVGRLWTGAQDLDGGMFKLVDGSTELAGGLSDGVEKIPDYDKTERDRRTEVMSDPVQLASQSLHKASNYGTGFAPYFIPLSLWVGAMVAYMLIQPLNRRALAAGSPAWRIALAGWLPVAGIGLLQVGALMSVLHWGLGLEMAHAAGTIGFLALTVLCFAAIIQWLNARFGAAGRILVLALLMLQLTSAGGTYPVQTSPGFFNAVHPYLPMTYVVESLRRLITGGGIGSVWGACAVLLAFTIGALALTALAARNKQVWTFDRLHPELSM
ncbi:YhgE/Pip family protein [Streptomyces sp. NPDC059828]|uniref:YhgE/Pip family protein n=1 Tax=Streptomyces sp. NPDC059828 TaxID=3346965 RepID=UPI0036698EEC